MKINKKIIVTGIIVGIMMCLVLGLLVNKEHNPSESTKHRTAIQGTTLCYDNEGIPRSAESQNYNDLLSVLETKIINYSNSGYFQQFYDPSLQATYYALYVLNAVGKLSTINQTEVFNYIISHYDSDLDYFMDEYAYRYLDTDFLKCYYPFTTVLEVNCYAVLSLDILNKLDQINIQDFIDFLWSCYNPVTSGFLGQPYSAALTDYFITATMDNTYYAVQTLDLLMGSWTSYTTERDELVQFVNDLQVSEVAEPECGGFYNDAESGFDSLYMYNPNLLGSFYCVKTLDVFGLIGTVNVADYHQYLEHLYDNDKSFFVMKPSYYNYTNIVATALGIELSDLTGSPIDVSNAVDFVLNNRNPQGTWDCSTDYSYHELIDIFQIVRSLSNYGATSQLTTDEKNQIANGLRNYESYEGFSLLSNDYTSLELINTIVNSFDLFDKIPDLDIQGLYNKIESVYAGICESFLGSLNMESSMPLFRSFPIEYYNLGNHNYVTEIDALQSHKTMFLALDALQQIFKLDDFGSTHDLLQIANNITKTQFLDGGYDNYGAFLPSLSLKYGYMTPEYKDKYILFEYTYYAIKSLELIADQLGLGDFRGLITDINALYAYISKNVVETPTYLHFNPQYSNKVEILLKNTYFAIYVLKALDIYDLNDQKIRNFVESNVNYTDVENIYYCYKISEILGLDISFELKLSQVLVETIYSPKFNEYYLTPNKQNLDQQAFLWICEMAMLGDINVDYQWEDPIELGSFNNVTVSLNNLIRDDFGPNIIVKFESNQIGIFTLNKRTDGCFQGLLNVADQHSNYPNVNGNLVVYDGTATLKELPVSFQTTSTRYSTMPDATDEEGEDPEGVSETYVEKDTQNAIPVMITMLIIPTCAIAVSYKMKNSSRSNFK